MRRFSSILIVCLIIGCLIGTVFPGEGLCAGEVFKDIEGHKAERDILKLGIKGIASGVPGSAFNPDKPITRIDAVSLITAIFEDPLSSQFGIKIVLNLPFKDVARLPYEQKKVLNEALKHGIIKGEPGIDFRADDFLSRSEAAAMIVRTLGFEGSIIKGGSVGSLPFSDVGDIPSWARPYIKKAFDLGLMGYGSGRDFKPDKAVTRAEMAVIVSEIDRMFLNHRDDIEHFGGVLAVRTIGGYALHVKLDSSRMRSYRVSDNVKAFNVNGKVIDFKDIETGDKIEFLLDERGHIVYIGIIGSAPSPLLRRVSGRITSTDSSGSAFRIIPDFPMEGETLVKVFLRRDTVVLRDGKAVSVSDIEKNMNVVVVGTVKRSNEIDGAREVSIVK